MCSFIATVTPSRNQSIAAAAARSMISGSAFCSSLVNCDNTYGTVEPARGLLMPIPSVYGMTIDKATSVLEGAGFQVAVGNQIDSELDRGLVAGSFPGSGESTSSGDTVTIYPSDGSPYKPPKKKRGGGGGRGGNGNGGGGRG